MPFRDPARARFSFHTTHDHSPCHHPRRHARLKVYPHLPHRPSNKTPQPATTRQPQLASHNSQEARQSEAADDLRVSLKPPGPLLATP